MVGGECGYMGLYICMIVSLSAFPCIPDSEVWALFIFMFLVLIMSRQIIQTYNIIKCLLYLGSTEKQTIWDY